ncbi:MAG TPA: MBL fold metallo-hydrolase [Sorangium sp.]|nr:MBL fold metallo-hydrolase [Sorangium sp.]
MTQPPIGSFALHLLDVGQGEAILLDLPNGAFALIDGGPERAKDIVLEAVAARANEGREFRFAAFTHWDADHIGGLAAVIRAHKPLELVRPSVELGLIKELCAHLDDKDAPRLIDEINEIETELRLSPIGARQPIRDVGDGVEIWALAPAETARVRMKEALHGTSPRRVSANLQRIRNDVSLVLWIRAFGRALLLPGEVDADMAAELMKQFGRASGNIHQDDPRAVWIKLSHHGSKTGTSGELVRCFAHDRFVASASHGAQYGHPHPRVLHIVRDEGRGHAMCTRLGKGCHLIQQNPKMYPAADPSWTETADWKEGPMPNEHCYGTITVTVHPDGACSVSGTSPERDDCPYGGPPEGNVSFPALQPEA